MSDNFTDEEIINRLDVMAKWDTATNEMSTEDHIGYMAARIIERLRAENKELVAKYNRDMATAERLDDCHVKEIIEKDKRIEELEATLRACRNATNSLTIYDACREVIGDDDE